MHEKFLLDLIFILNHVDSASARKDYEDQGFSHNHVCARVDRMATYLTTISEYPNA